MHKIITIAIALILSALILSGCEDYCFGAEIGIASYYTVESCMKESGQCVMANTEVLNDNRKTAASWRYPFGTRLKVSRLDEEGKTVQSVEVVVKDRGPAKSLVAKGRIIDLSYAAMHQLNGIGEGLIPVRVERIGGRAK